MKALLLSALCGLAGCLDEVDDSSTTQSIGIIEPPPSQTIVRTPEQLRDALAAGATDIFIPSGVSLRMNDVAPLDVLSGTHIGGTRYGLDPGALLYLDPGADPHLGDIPGTIFRITGGPAVIQGLRFRGPMTLGDTSNAEIAAITTVKQDSILIEDCELTAFTGAAIAISNSNNPGNYYTADKMLIRHNYIHHNVRDGAGYGVLVEYGGYATIDGNVFDYNRHAIAHDGGAHSGYIAHHNYVLEGGKTEGGTFAYYNQHFDVHGVGPGGYNGSAGEQFDIAYNTFRGDETYGGVTRRAFRLRGTPSVGAWFQYNILVHPDQTAAAEAQKVCTTRMGPYGPVTTCVNNPAFYATGNQYNIDRSGTMLVGDLDGDGLDDLFIATGNTWFYSSAGETEWRHLNDMTELTTDVTIGHFDTSVGADLFTVKNGHFYISTGGRGAWAPFGQITDSPAISQLRFGDFNGDGKTDVLRSDGSLWWVSYGGAGPWVALSQAQNIPLSELRFADFDGNQRTDVFHMQNGLWYWKKDGIGGWLRLNAAQWPTTPDLVFADFDGDGRADIGLLGAGGHWQYWSGGTAIVATALHVPSGGEIVGTPFATGHFVSYPAGPHPDGVLAWHAGNPYYNVDGDAGAGFAMSAGGGTAYVDRSAYKSMR